MFSMFSLFRLLLGLGLNVFEILIVVRVIVSFVPQWQRSTWGKIVTFACEPILFPLRRMVRLPGPIGAGLDFSPMLALAIIHLVRLLFRF